MQNDTNPFFSWASLRVGLALYLCLAIALLVYWPGLAGPFLFDDFPNLKTLGDNSQVRDWHSFVQFVLSGIAGPTGRPISLLSFLLNDVSWPSEPWSFKYTNLMIHCLNGVLLFWVSLKLCRLHSTGFIQQQAGWLALLASGLWLLHPLHVSTTLYVVQRMTMLAALFSLLGLLGYLWGREKLEKSPRLAYWLMSLAIGLCTLLAMLSKENGVVLPLLIAVVEFTVLRHQCQLKTRPNRLWVSVFLGLPTLAVIVYLLRLFLPSHAGSFAARGYTPWERLLTECRVLMHYLYDLLIPKLYSGSLYNDDFPLSTGLFSPLTTVFSVGVIIVLITLAVRCRRQYPIISLAILFYFSGHVLESTVTPLDLYYEHRNYLPSIFLFLPLAYATELKPKLSAVLVLMALLLYASFTLNKAILWRSEPELLLFWAEQHPNSPRAQREAANVYYQAGDYGKAIQILRTASEQHDTDFKLRFHRLVMSCLTGQFDQSYFDNTLTAIGQHSVNFDGQILEFLELLTSLSAGEKCQGLAVSQLKPLAEKLLENPAVQSNKTSVFALRHWQGMIALNAQEPRAALEYFDRALQLGGDPETGMLQTALLASHGFYPEALQHLETTENLLSSTPVIVTGALARHDYPLEIKTLRQTIQQEMAKSQHP